MISAVIPTRNRLRELARTLGSLSAADSWVLSEVIVIDNASDAIVRTPAALDNGVPIRLIRLGRNAGTAARNVGVEATDPRNDWVLMLDDDSAPIDGSGLDETLIDRLRAHEPDVAAVMADIVLPDGSRERGGLPEVFIGCGVLLRRAALDEVSDPYGVYDESFGYYAEEYDLAARLIAAGGRVVFDPAFRVQHRKVAGGRDMGVILGRLVRNNGWVIQRHAPEHERAWLLEHTIDRYRQIAVKENATAGFEAGLAELGRTLLDQPRTPLSDAQFDRWVGVAAAREALAERGSIDHATLVGRGKNDWAVERALRELGATVDGEGARVIATMSPGPMLDLASRDPSLVAPWRVAARAA